MSSMLPDFILPVRGVDPPTVDVPEISPQERRWRRVGLVGLGVLVLAVVAGLVAVVVGVLPAGSLGTALAVVGGTFLATGLLVDLVTSLGVRRRDGGVRPGLRAASFFYVGVLVCVVAALAFLTT